MEGQEKEGRNEQQWEARAPSATTRWLVILSALLFAIAIFTAGYAYEQNAAITDVSQQNQAMRAADAQMRSQMDSLTAKIDQMAAAQSAASAQAATFPSSDASGPAKPGVRRTASASFSMQNSRMKQVETKLAYQQKQLKQTQDDLAAARNELEGRLGSTRDELNGSIARTHDELVSLEKRGERSYYEFDLSKSKSFQREGPVELSLRKADFKHQNYDLMMLVDDHQLSKKKVDLYEPIWLHEADQPQPVQIIINQISKNDIHGYVSAPKYTESELESNTTRPSTDTQSKLISASPNSSSYSTSTPTSTPATSSQGHQAPVD